MPEGLQSGRLARVRSALPARAHVRRRASACSTSAAAKAASRPSSRARALQVVGIDVAEEPLRRARERHPELDLRRSPAEGPWPLEDASFDALWAGEMIEHVADTAGWLSEVRRVLRSGGSLLLSTPDHGRLRCSRWALSHRARSTPTSIHAPTTCASTRAARSRELLEDFGFRRQSTCERRQGCQARGGCCSRRARRSRF